MRSSFVAGHTILRPYLSDRLRSAYAFLTGRVHTALLEGSEGTLTARLARAYEGELRTGLRVLIIGVGIVAVPVSFLIKKLMHLETIGHEGPDGERELGEPAAMGTHPA